MDKDSNRAILKRGGHSYFSFHIPNAVLEKIKKRARENRGTERMVINDILREAFE